MAAATTTTTPTPDLVSAGDRHRLQLARVLMGAASASALLAAVGAIGVVADAGPDTQMVETWRGYGFMVFAGLFALLAAHPRRYRGVWELVLLQKVALTLTAIGYAITGAADGAATVLVWDGALSIVIGSAYLLCRGWTAGSEQVPS